jgi:hypothetical protein
MAQRNMKRIAADYKVDARQSETSVSGAGSRPFPGAHEVDRLTEFDGWMPSGPR